MKKRILFVDDEPNVLSGLRRMLRPFRDQWEMQFATDGDEAKQRLAEGPFDVVVTDMQMPAMDGAGLLKYVKETFPQTVRIILSGQSDKESIQRSIARTHQYLSKPCDPQLLQATVSRACALRDKLSDQALKQLVSNVTTLPSLPAVYHAVVTEFQSPEASIQRVAELISQDVAMTAKLLQLVNSSFFGLPRRIESPRHAAAMLGLDVLKPVVLSAGIFAKFDGASVAEYAIDDFTNHCMAVSRCAKRIAECEGAGKEQIEDSELAGLVHDVGQLVLAANLSEEYSSALAQARREKISLTAAETECLGADHADVGAYLLGLWGLPDPIVEAVAFHHAPDRCPADVFSPLTAVHVANCLISETKLSGPVSHGIEVDREYLDRLNLIDRLPQWEQIVHSMLEETQNK